MPGGDRTGPGGMGPMTGRAAGFCTGYSVPGYTNAVGGCGYGGFGRGFGRGFGWRAAGALFGAAVHPYVYGGAPTITPQQELDGLKGQAEYFEDSLDGIKKRIGELEGQKTGK